MKAIQDPSLKIQNRKLLLVNRQSTKAMLVFALLFMFSASHAQIFYGTTSGGAYGTGSIFKVNGDGTGYQETHLKANNGNNNTLDAYFDFDRYNLTHSSNGKIYGVTIGGGSGGNGVLYEFDPVTKEYNEKINFDFYNTSVSLGNMLEYNGKLYGTSIGMGFFIYSYDPATNDFQIEYTLPSLCPGMIFLNGKFYGMTTTGGLKRAGAIFEYNPMTKEYKALFQFDYASTGHYPEGGLTYHDGKLYGVTTGGGQYAQGTLFEFDLNTHQFDKKIDFKSDVNGSRPIGDLALYNNKLFGWASAGGNHNQGVLFEFDLTTEVLHKAIDFNAEFPAGSFQLINGKLYGTSTHGGGDGLLFSVDPETHEYARVFEFNDDANGGHPFGQLTLDDNTLVGMTQSGGYGNGGVIFKYDIASGQLQAETSFNYSPFGKKPVSLIEVNNTFYGLAFEGGATGNGALFELNPETFELTNLHDFICDQCDNEYEVPETEGMLVIDNNILYGILTKGGNYKGGELFAYNIDQKIYTTLVEFTTTETGLEPVGSIALVNNKIYGATKYGGSGSQGVLFEYDLANSTFQVKQGLGYYTTGLELQFISINNSLYGLGYGGNLRRGVLDLYDPVSNSLIPKYEFQNDEGGVYPNGRLFLSGSSTLLGTTSSGGTNSSNGVIFEFNPQTQVYTKIVDFPDYGSPEGITVFHANKVYGARSGGSLFQFDLDNAEYRTLITLDLGYGYGNTINSLIVHPGDFHTSPATVTEVIEFIQGKRKDGKPIDITKSNPQEALYSPNGSDSPINGIKFVSLGFGGSITLAFDNPLYDKTGIDLYVAETSYGNPSFYDYPEQAEVLVSQNGDEWTSLGYTHDHSSDPGNVNGPQETCRGKLDSKFDLHTSGLNWIQLIKIIDVTDPLAKRRDRNNCSEYDFVAFNSASDGFDLDGIFQTNMLYPVDATARIAYDNNAAMVNIGAPQATALLYPNPVSKILSINMAEEQELAIMEDDFHLEIIDTQGKTWTNSRELMDDTWTINHDVSKLNPGMYIARVTNGNVRRHYKFMKN